MPSAKQAAIVQNERGTDSILFVVDLRISTTPVIIRASRKSESQLIYVSPAIHVEVDIEEARRGSA